MEGASPQVGELASVNIRKFVVRATHLNDLVSLGTMTAQCAAFLETAVSAGLNFLGTGGMQADTLPVLPSWDDGVSAPCHGPSPPRALAHAAARSTAARARPVHHHRNGPSPWADRTTDPRS